MVINLGSLCMLYLVHIPTHNEHIKCTPCDILNYIYYSASYTHTMVIYSFCNTDDLSWGTKGCTSDSGQPRYYDDKVSFLGAWMISNTLASYILVVLNGIWLEKGNYFIIKY